MKMLKYKAKNLVPSALAFAVMATLHSVSSAEAATANACFITSANTEGKMSETAVTYQ